MSLEDSEALTTRELFQELIHKLRKQKIEDAEISARWIVEEAVGLNGVDFFTKQDEKLTVRMVAAADSMSERRIKGEPLQYVVGHWGFRELDLAVDRRALIPRPETESLVEQGIQYLNSLTSSDKKALKVVELGTGSGAIALSIAKEIPESIVHATDVSDEALSLTRSNLAGLGRAASRVSLYQGSWLDPLPDVLRGDLDLVISNPPYVAESDELPAVVKDWEPGLALFAPANGFAH
ncbi:MAG: peptide chain release factor N(5)-glutamine methyltransferase [Acidimicrobiales bacterium]|nr:peptide chain release factor N(5)-glutamine methyltransferase [Acidimicrobiales bacterium]